MLSTPVIFTTTNYSASIVTLCDGHPRISGTLTPTATGITTTYQADQPAEVTFMAPACSVQPSDCALLHSSYDASYERYISALEAFRVTKAPTTLSLATNLQTFVMNNMTTTFAPTGDAGFPTVTVESVAYTVETLYSTVVGYWIDGFGRLDAGGILVDFGRPPIPEPTQQLYCSNDQTYSEPQSTSTWANCSTLSSIYWASSMAYSRSSKSWYINLPETTLSLASDLRIFISGNVTTSFMPNPTVTDTRPTLTINATAYLPQSTSTMPLYYDITQFWPILTPGGTAMGQKTDWDQSYTGASSPAKPVCESPCSDSPCTIFGGTVQLLYFPVSTTVSRNMCAHRPTNYAAQCPLGPLKTPLSEIMAKYSATHRFRANHEGAPYLACPYVNANISTKDSGMDSLDVMLRIYNH